MRLPIVNTAVTAALIGAALTLPIGAASAATTTPKAGAKCTKAGATSGAFVCTKKAGILVWAKASTGAATTAASAATTAAAAAGATTGIDGTWKATSQSVAGYRVKESFKAGVSTEAVGRTSGVTGMLTIAGTKATAAQLVVDMTTLKSDESRRDAQVQGRIMETSQFPTATVKLTSPIDFGKVPADKELVSTTAKVDLTAHGTTKAATATISARRNGANIEVQGTIPILFSDYGIPNPSFPGFVTTEDHGVIEFLVVFSR